MESGFNIRLPPRFSREELGAGVTIFSMDNYMDRTLPELLDGQGNPRVTYGRDFFPNHNPNHINMPFEGHGDCMMIHAAGRITGLAPAANIVAINLFREGIDGGWGEDVYRGFRWIVGQVRTRGLQNRAVVSMALTGVGPNPDDFGLRFQRYIERIDMDVLGLIVVHSAGNTNREITDAEPLYPQMSDQVLVVAGMACDGYFWKDVETDVPGVLAGSNFGEVVDLVAPCEDLPAPLRNGVVLLIPEQAAPSHAPSPLASLRVSSMGKDLARTSWTS
ncbi:subtilisin-like protein [Ascobolus immersus RN42]|uniref:Subtilisin-like protein n=1 Tax=Ascobolus immersus RN42 TaxID=1160509 RepID=A0A3N4I7X6_ASCIM|nr:subtilisin-like protein [Ascobolus immersus RN42]